MYNFLNEFDWYFYRNLANSRFICGRTGALQSYGSSNLFIVLGLSLLLFRLFLLLSEYKSIWYIAKHLQSNPKAIHLSGMAEYTSEILNLYFIHFRQILKFKRKFKAVPIPRIHMPLSLNSNSLKLTSATANSVSSPKNVKLEKNPEDDDYFINFNFDCTKTTFVSAHWGVPVDIVYSAIVPRNPKKDTFRLSILNDTVLNKAKKMLRKLLIPFYNEQCEMLLDQPVDLFDTYKVSGDISLLCNEDNFCSSDPICFNAGTKINCSIKPWKKFIEVDGKTLPIWKCLTSHDELLQSRVPLVIVLYTPRTQEPRVFAEGDVESHQGYAEITIVRFRKPNEVLIPFVTSPKISPKVVKQVVFCGEYISPQEPRDMFGMGDVKDKECLICIANDMDTVLLPCGHGSFCSRCLFSLRNDKCPVCRRSFYSYVKFPLKSRAQ